ncbi:hypothetical protein Tco_0570141 [Tanacetum coccineum]
MPTWPLMCFLLTQVVQLTGLSLFFNTGPDLQPLCSITPSPPTSHSSHGPFQPAQHPLQDHQVSVSQQFQSAQQLPIRLSGPPDNDTSKNPLRELDTGASSRPCENYSPFVTLLHKPLHLHHVLVTPNIIKNLISVRQFTRDNNVSVDFDAYGFSVKDYQTRRLLLRCDSTGDLYPVTQQPSTHFVPLPLLYFESLELRGHSVLHFALVFDIVHSDLWTSPISSESDSCLPTTAQLTAYTDADWAGCPVTRRSNYGLLCVPCLFAGVPRDKRNLLLELHAPLTTATLVYCDNVSAVLGFGNKWHSWIIECLHSSRASVLINGNPTFEFSVKRGFKAASGLNINIHKSNIYGIGVSDEEVSDMATSTRCTAGAFPFSYLGIPIGYNMNRVPGWQILIDCFKSRLSSWKANLLSIEGRLTLIKSVLGSLGIYFLLIFKALEIILKSLESLHANFF